MYEKQAKNEWKKKRGQQTYIYKTENRKENNPTCNHNGIAVHICTMR